MKFPEVSDEQLLVDIKNTQEKIRARDMIEGGYRILIGLPELNGQDRALCRLEIMKQQDASSKCLKLLAFLLNLKKEKGIKGEGN